MNLLGLVDDGPAAARLVEMERLLLLIDIATPNIKRRPLGRAVKDRDRIHSARQAESAGHGVNRIVGIIRLASMGQNQSTEASIAGPLLHFGALGKQADILGQVAKVEPIGNVLAAIRCSRADPAI